MAPGYMAPVCTELGSTDSAFMDSGGFGVVSPLALYYASPLYLPYRYSYSALRRLPRSHGAARTHRNRPFRLSRFVGYPFGTDAIPRSGVPWWVLDTRARCTWAGTASLKR